MPDRMSLNSLILLDDLQSRKDEHRSVTQITTSFSVDTCKVKVCGFPKAFYRFVVRYKEGEQ